MQIEKQALAEVLDYIARLESDAAEFPQENSDTISFSDVADHLLKTVPGAREDVVSAAKRASRHVFIPKWLKETSDAD